MNVFEFDKYKDFVVQWVKNQPKRGHGQFRLIARSLNTSSTIVSQVFKGSRQLTLEQAAELCRFFEFTELETEYFLALVLRERSGHHRLLDIFNKQISNLKKKSQELKHRLPHEEVLSDAAKATFYSQWYYTGIRNLVAIPEFDSVESVAEYLDLSRPLVHQVVEFLLRYRLCLEEKGKLKTGPQRTHLEANSLLVSRHHRNWRLKTMERFDRLSADEICYTCPMSLSREAVPEIRREIVNFIEKTNKIVLDSPSEQTACLNIDWVKY